jgi:MinD-like ATPase involved in chromosome partitioning or flagellar assembly
MALVVFGSIHGAPGVSTLVASLALSWPEGQRPLVVEADPDGGTLAASLGLAPAPGLLELVARSRSGFDPAGIEATVQPLGRGDVVVCPASADQTLAALKAMGPGLPRHLAARAGYDVLVDVGRLRPGSEALVFAAAAELLVVMVEPALATLGVLAARVTGLRERAELVIVLRGDGYPVREIEAALDVEVLATVPDNRRATANLGAARLRSPYWRAAASLAETIVHRLRPDGSPWWSGRDDEVAR